jgi:microcompartment protein CcmL/EutN
MDHIIGILETKGLIPAVAAVDSVLKNTDAVFLGFEFIGDGVVVSKFSAPPVSIDFVLKEAKEQAEKNGGYIASVSINIENERIQKLLLNSKRFNSRIIPDEIAAKKIVSPFTKNNRSLEENLNTEINISPVKIKKAVKKSEPIKSKQKDNQRTTNEENLSSHSETIERLKREALSAINKKNDLNDEQSLEINQPINIENMNVHELRHFVRSINNFPIKGRQISRANRNELIAYYKSLQG